MLLKLLAMDSNTILTLVVNAAKNIGYTGVLLGSNKSRVVEWLPILSVNRE
jgi:hypothetical protein